MLGSLTNRQPDFLQDWELVRWSSRAQNIYNTKFCKNRYSGSWDFRELFSRTGNPIFYKVETYLDLLFVHEIYVMLNFVKIVWAVLEIYDSCVHEQTGRQADNPIFYEVETYLDRLLVPELHVIPNFVKIFRAVPENVNMDMHIKIYILISTCVPIYIQFKLV